MPMLFHVFNIDVFYVQSWHLFSVGIIFQTLHGNFDTLSLDVCSVPSVCDRYKSYSPYDMKESIRKEVKGDLEKSFLTLGN